MPWILAALFAIIELALDHRGPGLLIAGAFIGFLLGRQFQLEGRLRRLERERLSSPPPVPPEPTKASATPVSPQPVASDGTDRPAPPSAAPATQAEPRQPAWLDRVLEQLWARGLQWLTGGNSLLRVGMLVLFIGLAFLVKYAADQGLLPLHMRLGIVAIVGLGLAIFGWQQRQARPQAAWILQGGGLACLYLTLYAAGRLYGLLSLNVTLAGMILLVALTLALALLQNARGLAVTATVGGFLAPILASTGEGSHIALFSYFAVLNLGVLATAIYRAWRELNVLGLAFTAGIGLTWGVLDYQAADQFSAVCFTVLFFLIYVGTTALFAIRTARAPGERAGRVQGYVDATVTFGNPIATLAALSQLLTATPRGMTIAALLMAGFYAALTWLALRYARDTLWDLTTSFAILAIAAATIAVPYALGPTGTGVAWAIEGAAMVWVGCRQQRRWTRVSGCLLQAVGGAVLLLGAPGSEQALAGPDFAGQLAIALAGLASAWLYRKRHERVSHGFEYALERVLVGWFAAWWFITWVHELSRVAGPDTVAALTLAVVLISLAALGWLGRHALGAGARWEDMDRLLLMWLPAMGLCAWLGWTGHPEHHLLAGLGWIVWPAAFVGLYRLLARGLLASPGVIRVHHLGAALLLIAAVSVEGMWIVTQIAPPGTGRLEWLALAAMLPPVAVMLALSLPAARGRLLAVWPLRVWPDGYGAWLPTLLAPAMGLCWLGLHFASGAAVEPLFVPLLNPVELTQTGILASLASGWLCMNRIAWSPLSRWPHRLVPGVLLGAALLQLTVMVGRAMHHFAAVPFEAGTLMDSMVVQTAVSLSWSTAALGLMMLATRRGDRLIWLTAAALLGAVVIKLFVIDLADSGTLARVISFMGVGALMLIAGWRWPIPPRTHPTET